VRPLLEQSVTSVGAWLREAQHGLPPDRLAASSVLPDMTVRALMAHLVVVADSVLHLRPLPRSAPVLGVAEYVGGYPAGAGLVLERSVAVAEQVDDLAGEYATRWQAAFARLDELGPAVTKVSARRGPATLADFLVTRVVELVVHGDDLARSVPERAAPELPREASHLVARTLLDALAQRHPGQALEVRVPPVAAVQCLPGPRHTRGTPPGVVETDPLTWTRLAAGRLAWADALVSGRVRASGQRADLSPVLPLL
jgi:uncharacterized protein (TIGR03083 family)